MQEVENTTELGWEGIQTLLMLLMWYDQVVLLVWNCWCKIRVYAGCFLAMTVMMYQVVLLKEVENTTELGWKGLKILFMMCQVVLLMRYDPLMLLIWNLRVLRGKGRGEKGRVR
jgi:hypothetical protein